MNPTTHFNNEEINLQPLGTEGQGTSLSNKKNYSLIQLCIPIGAGIKMTLGKRSSLSLEFGLRKTFTDYLDDIHADNYVNPDKLADESGGITSNTVGLSNRSLDNNSHGKRGTSATKDWYVFSGFMLTFKLGKKSTCFYHN